MNKWMKRFEFVLLLVIVAAVMTACMITTENSTDETTENGNAPGSLEVVSVETDKVIIGQEIDNEENKDRVISTKYIQFSYPAEYEDDVVIEIAETEKASQLIASANINERIIELFTLSMSVNATDGYKVGSLWDETAGNIGIYIIMNEQNVEGWSDAEYAKISLLQESINEFIFQINEDARFVKE